MFCGEFSSWPVAYLSGTEDSQFKTRIYDVFNRLFLDHKHMSITIAFSRIRITSLPTNTKSKSLNTIRSYQNTAITRKSSQNESARNK